MNTNKSETVKNEKEIKIKNIKEELNKMGFDIDKEYELIKQKKSYLSSNDRKIIISIMENE